MMSDRQVSSEDDNDQIERAIAALEAQLAALRQQSKTSVKSGAAAVGKRAKAVGNKGILVDGDVEGSVLGADAVQIIGDVYMGPQAQDAEQALKLYRRVLAHSCASLPMRGIDLGASDPTTAQKQLGLANVYVHLDTTRQVKEEAKSGKGKKSSSMDEQEHTRPLPVLEAVIKERALVLLGDPGSGKSTFVNYLAYCLSAHALQPEGGWLDHLPGWDEEEADMLPILVILRDFAFSLPEKLPSRAEPRHLWDFICLRLESQNLELASEPICRALEAGEALLLLDGLDEVPADQRKFVRDAVRAFLVRYPGNRVLTTCRVLSYQPPRSAHETDLRLTELADFTLAAFDEPKIDRFIDSWYAELARIGSVRRQDEVLLASRLKSAVRRPDLWRLASNPLLLTVMSLVHAHKGRLPDARALLYEDTVDILLWRWEEIKAAGREQAPTLRQVLLEAGRSEVDLKRVLWKLAYEAHSGVSASDDGEALADIGELRLEKAIAELKDDDRNWAHAIIQTIKLRAGLLIERSPETFTFPHRTFQEYLAGAHLASQANFAVCGKELAQAGAHWRVVILLAVGRLVYLSGDLDKPLVLLSELCPSELDEDDPGVWANTWLAGDVLLEIGTNRVKDSALGRDLLGRVRTRLVKLIEWGALAPVERAAAGDCLAQLGDPRFDARFWHLPGDPRLGFVEVPAGAFLMGSDPKKDTDAYDREFPQHELDLPAYYLGRYPVTVAQFAAFVEDTGFEPGDRNSLQGLPTRPVVWVSWHEALAYCRWLEGKLLNLARDRIANGSQDAFWAGLATGDLGVSLPSEAEWEKAARGTDGRIYPWGDKFNPQFANMGDTDIDRTSAVGCFPVGSSPYGALDLSGNVWEWTHSLWGKDWQNPDFKYPYLLEDGREALDAPSEIRRVLRGGAFFNLRGGVRCAYRFDGFPDLGHDYVGFRVVVSPAAQGAA